MLNNIYLITAIAVALFTLTAMTITSFLWVNNSFRKYLKELLKRHDDGNRAWTKRLFQDYYYTLEENLTEINVRLNQLEKRCDREHGYEQKNNH